MPSKPTRQRAEKEIQKLRPSRTTSDRFARIVAWKTIRMKAKVRAPIQSVDRDRKIRLSSRLSPVSQYCELGMAIRLGGIR